MRSGALVGTSCHSLPLVEGAICFYFLAGKRVWSGSVKSRRCRREGETREGEAHPKSKMQREKGKSQEIKAINTKVVSSSRWGDAG